MSKYMERALELARIAYEEGEVPVGQRAKLSEKGAINGKIPETLSLMPRSSPLTKPAKNWAAGGFPTARYMLLSNLVPCAAELSLIRG